MVKDTNTRDKVTLTKEQSKQLEEIAKEKKMSKSALIAFAVSCILSYKAGDMLGDLILNRLDEERREK